jgi:hypothetical protein
MSDKPIIEKRHNIVSVLNVRFVPKADSSVYSSPVASNTSAGIFAGILKIEKT